MSVLENPYALRNFVKRKQDHAEKITCALVTDLNLLSGYRDFVALMELAAKEAPDPWFIHYYTRTQKPADTCRLVPSLLSQFNRSRVLRRARVSGLRMCNACTNKHGSTYYVSDIFVPCSFDAVAIASGIADAHNLGSRIYVRFGWWLRGKGKKHFVKEAELYKEKFWRSSCLTRHSCLIDIVADEYPTYVTLVFTSQSLSLPALLQHILDAFRSVKELSEVMIGQNDILRISRHSLDDESLYMTYQQLTKLSHYRYRNYAAFGTYFRNPNFQFYK